MHMPHSHPSGIDCDLKGWSTVAAASAEAALPPASKGLSHNLDPGGLAPVRARAGLMKPDDWGRGLG